MLSSSVLPPYTSSALTTHSCARGSHFDIYLKFENRQHWGGLLLRHLGLESDPVFQQFVKTSQIPFMGADTVEVLLQHYTPAVLELVRDLYKDDIKAFDYEKDVDVLANIIASVSSGVPTTTL
jgi:hypothetical protein